MSPRAQTWLTALFLSAIALHGVPWGCAGATGSKRFSFEASAGGAERNDTAAIVADGTLSFTNQQGWNVTLSKADVTIGPVYLNVVAPLTDTAQSWLGLFVTSAWANGEGALGSGRVVGEVLGQLKFNALSPNLVPFPVRGSMTEDEVRTADVWFYPEPGVSADATDNETVAVDVSGVAVRGATTVRFRGALILNSEWQPAAASGTRSSVSITEIRKVRGIQSSFFAREGGRLELRVDVARLFRGADFSNLEDNPNDRDGTKVLVQAKAGKVTTDQVMTNLYQGLRQATGTYSVRWVNP